MHKLPEKVMQYQSQIANQAKSMRKYGEHITHLHISDIVTFETDITDT